MAGKTKTKFYKTRDWVLAREREGKIPDVFHDTTRSWSQYPALDVYHDARLIEPGEALGMMPKGCTAEHLEAEPGVQVPVDGGASKAPLLPAGSP